MGGTYGSKAQFPELRKLCVEILGYSFPEPLADNFIAQCRERRNHCADWKNVVGLCNSHFAVRAFLGGCYYMVGLCRDVETAARLADATTFHFWKYRRNGAETPTDSAFNFTATQAAKDANEPQVFQHLNAVEQFLKGQGILDDSDVEAFRTRHAKRTPRPNRASFIAHVKDSLQRLEIAQTKVASDVQLNATLADTVAESHRGAISMLADRMGTHLDRLEQQLASVSARLDDLSARVEALKCP